MTMSTPHSGTRRGRERAHRIEAETQDIVSPPGAVERPMAELWGDGGVRDMGSVPGSNSNIRQSDYTHFVRCSGSHISTRLDAERQGRHAPMQKNEAKAMPCHHQYTSHSAARARASCHGAVRGT